MDMWTLRLWAFSKRFPHWSQANSSSVSALCLVMWYLSDARCRHWNPQISHLQGKAGAQHPAQAVWHRDRPPRGAVLIRSWGCMRQTPQPQRLAHSTS